MLEPFSIEVLPEDSRQRERLLNIFSVRLALVQQVPAGRLLPETAGGLSSSVTEFSTNAADPEMRRDSQFGPGGEGEGSLWFAGHNESSAHQ